MTAGAAVRQTIHAAVTKFPGIHLRELERITGESAALISYHMEKLVAEGFAAVREHGGYTRFFPTTKGKATRLKPEDQVWVGMLREQVPLHIVLVLLDDGPLPHGAIVEKVGVAKSTLSYHLAKLAQAHIVVREGRSIRLADRERTYRLLLTYTPTPSLLDAFADLWESLYG